MRLAVGPLCRQPDIQFAPYGADYQSKVDFAKLENQYPLKPADLEKITPKYLAGLEQEQVDQIYARLTPGPIPDGAFDGDLFFAKGGSGKFRISEIAGGVLNGFVFIIKTRKLDLLGETLWKGKVFYRDQRVLRNRTGTGKPAGANIRGLLGAVTVMDTPTSPQRPHVFVEGNDGHLWVDWWG